MTEVNRREMVTLLGLTAMAAACGPRPRSDKPSKDADGIKVDAPAFFTRHEFATVTLLADLIIPGDERSGSASEAGAAAYIDYALREVEDDRTRLSMRGGLAWLDAESERRFGHRFVDATPVQRTGILDDIAFPTRAPAALSQGAAFFSDLRDLVATAFWSSAAGAKDLQYQGNVALAEWTGCPEPALQKLGVRYEQDRPREHSA